MTESEMSVEQVRAQLHRQAQEAQDETVRMYQRWAAAERERGNAARAAVFAERAERERKRPLPNAA